MKKRIILQLVLVMIFVNQQAQVIKTENGVILENFGCSTHLLKVEVISSHIIHIVASPIGNFSEKDANKFQSYGHPDFSVKIDNDRITIRTDALSLYIDTKSGRILYKDEGNQLLLEEKSRSYRPYKGFLENTWSVKQEFKWQVEESLFAFNQGTDKLSNIRGKNMGLFSQWTSSPNSLIVSSKGYGLLWNNPNLSRFYDGNDFGYIWSEVADQVNYYFLYGPSSEEVVFNYCKLTGKLLFLPKWANIDNLQDKKNFEIPKKISQSDSQFLKENLIFNMNVTAQNF